MHKVVAHGFQIILLAAAVAWQTQATAQAKEAPAAIAPTTITAEAEPSPVGPDVGYKANNSAAASKTSTPLAETPRSVSVVTQQRIKDQQAQTLTDILGYTPGIFSPPFAVGDGLAGDYFFIRGFNATDYGYGLYRDGLRVQGNRYDTTSEPYGLERVEVFRGPSSILYGENAPGGLVNLVSKRPTADSRGEVQASYGSNNRRQLGLDVSGPLTDDGSVLGRVVMLGRKSDTQVDHVPDDRFYIAPSITFNLSDSTALTLLSSYQRDRTAIELGYPAAGTLFNNPNGKLSRNAMLGNPDWDKFERETWSLGYEFSHQFNDVWTFRQNSRYLQSRIDRHEIWPGALNQGGFGTTVAVSAYDRQNKSMVYSLDNQLEGKFDTGNFQHTLLFGAGYDRTSYSQDWNANDPRAPILVNVFNPVYAGDPTTPLSVADSLLTQNLYGTYSQLQTKYDNWIFLLGGRMDWAQSEYRNRRTFAAAAQDDSDWNHKFTWQTGLMYQFDNGLSPYVSYARGFVPVQQPPVNGPAFSPITSEQYEVGMKYEPKGWNTSVTASAFDLRKDNDVITENNLPRQVGESRSKGFELEINSNLTDNLNWVTAYTYTDARITKDAPGSRFEDRQMTGVPRNFASSWLTYRFKDGELRGLRLSGGVRYIDSVYSYTTTYGKLDTGDVTLVDAGIGYDFDRHWSLDVNAKNLFDKEYVSGCNDAGRCYWGDERSVIGTVAYRW